MSQEFTRSNSQENEESDVVTLAFPPHPKFKSKEEFAPLIKRWWKYRELKDILKQLSIIAKYAQARLFRWNFTVEFGWDGPNPYVKIMVILAPPHHTMPTEVPRPGRPKVG